MGSSWDPQKAAFDGASTAFQTGSKRKEGREHPQREERGHGMVMFQLIDELLLCEGDL